MPKSSRKVPVFSPKENVLWLQSSDLGTREVVTCDWPFEICASNALFHMPHDTFCALVLLFAKQNSRPFWPQTPVLWEKVVKTLNTWGSRIQVCVSNCLWFNPWSMHGPQPQNRPDKFLHFSISDCDSLEFGVG